MPYGVQLYAIQNYAGSASLQPVEMDELGRLKTDAELQAADNIGVYQISGHSWSIAAGETLDVRQVSGSSWSVSAGETLDVRQVSGASWSITPLNGETLDVKQVSGASWSVTPLNGETLDVKQVSGASWSVTPLNGETLDVKQVSGANWSVEIQGSLTSTVVTGTTLHDAVDDGDAPLKIGGIVMKANPSAVADGDRTAFRADDIGRQLVRPHQTRDLIKTAYAQYTTGTEATLLSGSVNAFHDLLVLTAANNSDAATGIDIRASTGGTVVFTVQCPANQTTGFVLPVPYPQHIESQTWTVDLPDITGTTISVSALFAKEV